MREMMRALCSPILGMFESGEGQYHYKRSHRTILMAVGVLCFIIATVSLVFTIKTGELAGIIPILVFMSTGIVCEIVGFLGSDQAVASIWKRR